MNTHAPIIVAVDFSTFSHHLLAHGAKLASASGCGLVAAHVIHENLFSDWVNAVGHKASIEDRIKEVTPLLKELVDRYGAGLNTEIDIQVGCPHKVLAKMVTEKHAGLLILGARKGSHTDLGTVARHCARSAPSSVLIFRDWQGLFFKKIAVCVDLPSSSSTALERAIDFVSIHQASLEIIHVIYPPDSDPWGKVMEQPMDSEIPYTDRVRTRAAKQLDSFLAPFASRLAGIEWSTLLLESQSPAAVIAAHVDAENIDLTVSGPHDSSWVFDLVLGTTAECLLHDSKSSLLIIRDPQPEDT